MPTHNPLADLASVERETVLRGLKPYSQHSLNARFPFWDYGDSWITVTVYSIPRH